MSDLFDNITKEDELAELVFTVDIRLEKMMKESRKNLVKQKTQKARETVIALGLLESYEIKMQRSPFMKEILFLSFPFFLIKTI